MPSFLQSKASKKHESTGRTIGSPFLFPALPADVRRELRNAGVLREYTDGQIIHQRGDPSDGFSVIESGQVKMGRYGPDGDMHVVAILGPQDSFGEPSCLGGFPRVADAVALGPAEILWVAEAALFKVLDNSPMAARAFLKVVSVQFQEMLDSLVLVRKLSSLKQVARALAALCGSRPAPVSVTIRHDELAELVGVTRMTFGTALSRLEADGLIARRYRHLVVLDPAGLRRAGRP